MEYKYTAIILSKHDIKETDRIYMAYTLENGKIKAVARSVRKAQSKLAGSLENFMLIDLMVARSRGMGTVTGAVIEKSFLALRNNLFALEKAYASLAILNKLIGEEEKDERIFYLLEEYLETIDRLCRDEAVPRLYNKNININNESKIELVSQGFLFNLLDFLGYRLEIRNCIYCALPFLPQNNFFDPKAGGFGCSRGCNHKSNNKIAISDNTIKLVRIFYSNNLSSLTKLQTEPRDRINLGLVLNNFLSWIN